MPKIRSVNSQSIISTETSESESDLFAGVMTAVEMYYPEHPAYGPERLGSELLPYLKEPIAMLEHLASVFAVDEPRAYAERVLKQLTLLRARTEMFERVLIEITSARKLLSNRRMGDIAARSASTINTWQKFPVTTSDFEMVFPKHGRDRSTQAESPEKISS